MGTEHEPGGDHVTYALAFLLGLLTGTTAGITGGALIATHIWNRPRRAK
jgi:hypothetical protein